MQEKKITSVQSTNKSERNLKSPIDQWMGLNQILKTYKIMGVASVILNFVLVGALLSSFSSPPVVVIKDKDKSDFYLGRYQDVKLDQKALQEVVKRFVMLRFEWEELNPNKISDEIKPLTTSGANKKIRSGLLALKKENFEKKSVSQTVTDLRVDVSGGRVAASFDKILKIEGLPIPVPTFIQLQLVEGNPTVWNPEGLYVNGIIERQVN